MSIVLVGGGPDTTRSPAVVAPFLETCRSTSVEHVAVLLTGSAHIAARFAWDYLELLAPLDADVRVVPLDGGPVAEEIRTAGALVVGGGPTPVYREALAPFAPVIQERVAAGMPYLGFSAGSMIAATRSLAGGYRLSGVEVCSQECSEELDELTVLPGLGLVPWLVDSHAAQAGTLSRAVGLVEGGLCPEAVAIDEDTAVVLENDGAVRVIGSGQVWWVRADLDGTRVGAQRA